MRQEKERGEDKKKKRKKKKNGGSTRRKFFLKLSAFRQKPVSHGSSWRKVIRVTRRNYSHIPRPNS